jgi:hypothetical protein
MNGKYGSKDSGQSDHGGDEADPSRVTSAAAPWWWTFGRCLTATSPDTLSQLGTALQRASVCGATPFEVIAGAPFARYGARVTFEHPSPGTLAREFGLGDHPWGTPRWFGVRVAPGGRLRVKAYHRVERIDERFELPPSWPRDLYPVMASLDGDSVEIYLRKRDACEFVELAARCLAPLGLPPPETAPAPRPHHDAMCVSLRRERGRLSAISLYADWRALPRDTEIERIWSAGLDEGDRIAYQLALAGVRSLGFLALQNWHSMLAWTAEATGERHRAVSLSVPRPVNGDRRS